MSEAEQNFAGAVAFGGGEVPFRAVLRYEKDLCAAFDPARAQEWFAAEETAALAEVGTSAKRRSEWIAARMALKDLLVRDGVARRAAEAVIRKDALGCPRVVVWEADTGRYEEIACSLSHSAPFVLCAYLRGRDAAIGVDVEPRAWRISRLRRKFVSQGDAMLQKDDSIGDDTLLWSFKESLSKLLGTGWSSGFSRLACRETAPGVCVIADADGAETPGRYIWFGKWALTAVWREPAPAREPPPRRRAARFSLVRRLRLAARRRSMRGASGRRFADEDVRVGS